MRKDVHLAAVHGDGLRLLALRHLAPTYRYSAALESNGRPWLLVRLERNMEMSGQPESSDTVR